MNPRRPYEPQRAIRVLHVTQSLGGVETYLRLFLQNAREESFQFELVCPDGSLARDAAQWGVRVHTLEMRRAPHPVDLVHLLRLRRIMSAGDFDIVHCHSSKAGVLGRLAAWLASVPLVAYTPHAFGYLGYRGLLRSLFLWIEIAMRPFTTLVVAGSTSEEKRAVHDVRHPAERVKVVSNAVELPPTVATERQEDPKVTMVGRICHQKNPEMFVRVAGIVREARPDIGFELIGAGYSSPLEKRVRELVERLGLSDAVELVPWLNREDVLGRIARSHLCVLTSRFESFGFIVAEAMSLSVPVVATDVDGIRDVVENGVSGYLVAVDDDATMARRIVALLGDRDARVNMGAAGRARVERHFDVKVMAQRLCQTYREMV